MAATKDLAEILSKRDAVKYKAIIERAGNEGYHDFRFDRIPNHPEYADDTCPKIRLVDDLAAFPELADIRQQVMDGVYDDESPNEADEQAMRGTLINDNSPDGLFTALGFAAPTKEEREQWKQKSKLN